MAWENLPTNYKNAKWAGLKKYRQISNTDGTVSFEDVTIYTDKEDSFFGAEDANRMNDTVNNIVTVGIKQTNLLHNWYFANPVNRKGATEYTAVGYTTDRWMLTNTSGKVTVENDGISLSALTANTWLRQFVESPEGLYGKQINLSAMVNGVVYTTTGVIPTEAVSADRQVCLVTYPGGNLALFKRTDGSLSVQFYVSNGNTIKITAAKLEVGNVQTLARQDASGNWVLFEIPDYAEQYALCSQYDLGNGRHMGVAPIEGNAGNHNSIYRGKFLGNTVKEEQYAAISAGTFDDLFIGDYWTIDGVNYRIAAFDYYYNRPPTTTTHHVTIVPDSIMYEWAMSDTDSATPSYVNSKVYIECLPQVLRTINTAFGWSHVLNHRRGLVNAISNTRVSGHSWYDSTVELMTEANVFGHTMNSSLDGEGSANEMYTHPDVTQYPLFALRPEFIATKPLNVFWLRDPSPGHVMVCGVNAWGTPTTFNPTTSRGVRPAFSIIG